MVYFDQQRIAWRNICTSQSYILILIRDCHGCLRFVRGVRHKYAQFTLVFTWYPSQGIIIPSTVPLQTSYWEFVEKFHTKLALAKEGCLLHFTIVLIVLNNISFNSQYKNQYPISNLPTNKRRQKIQSMSNYHLANCISFNLKYHSKMRKHHKYGKLIC